jgi:hypothetical protein
MFSDIEYTVCDSGSSAAWNSYTIRDTLTMNNGVMNSNALIHTKVYKTFQVNPQYSIDSMMFVDSIGVYYQFDISRSSYNVSNYSEIKLVKFCGDALNLSVDVQKEKHVIRRSSANNTIYTTKITNKVKDKTAISLNGKSINNQSNIKAMGFYIHHDENRANKK